MNIVFSRYIVIANSNESGDLFFQWNQELIVPLSRVWPLNLDEHTSGLWMYLENLLQLARGSGVTTYHWSLQKKSRLRTLIIIQTLQLLVPCVEIQGNIHWLQRMHLEKIKRQLNLQSLVRIFFIVCLFCVKSSWLNLFPGKVIWNQCVVNVSIYTTLLERNSNRPAWYNCVICLLYIRFLFHQVKKVSL